MSDTEAMIEQLEDNCAYRYGKPFFSYKQIAAELRRLSTLQPEEAAYRRVPAVPSLDLLEQMVEVYTGYLSPMDKGLAQHMEGMRLALEAAAASCLPQPHSTSEKT